MGTIDLVALEIFRTVAEQGGIGRAAMKLNRVQSNVTTRVKQLEHSLGVALFLRQGRGIVLSPEGRVLLSYAERLLQLSAEAESAVRVGVPQGTLRLGALESLAATRLPPILSRFHAAHPAVRIDLVTGTTAALVGRVRAHEIDGALVAQPFDGRGLDARVVFIEELVLIGPKGAARIRTPRDIGNPNDHRVRDRLCLPSAPRALVGHTRGARACARVWLISRDRRLRRGWIRHRGRAAIGRACPPRRPGCERPSTAGRRRARANLLGPASRSPVNDFRFVSERVHAGVVMIGGDDLVLAVTPQVDRDQDREKDQRRQSDQAQDAGCDGESPAVELWT
jgi:DNA-binding transcriptional LysR family regulator